MRALPFRVSAPHVHFAFLGQRGHMKAPAVNGFESHIFEVANEERRAAAEHRGVIDAQLAKLIVTKRKDLSLVGGEAREAPSARHTRNAHLKAKRLGHIQTAKAMAPLASMAQLTA